MDIAQTARELLDEKYPLRGHRTGEVLRSMLVGLSAAEQRATDAEALLREIMDGSAQWELADDLKQRAAAFLARKGATDGK